jgi:hypothetical protein
MITVSDQAGAVLDGRTFKTGARMTVTYGGEVLLDDCPIIEGREEFDNTVRVPERATFTVPRIVDGVDLIPTAANSPLAPYGQRVHIKLGIGVAGRSEWYNRGEFLLQSASLEGNTIAVTVVGLLALIDEAGLVLPFKPTGTLTTSLRALVEPALTVSVSAAVTALDRSVPSGVNQDDDRLGAVLEILDAWPARAQVTPAGFLEVRAVDDFDTGPDIQLYNFTDDVGVVDQGANVVDVGGAITRDGLFNTVVARGQGVSGEQVTGIVYDATPGGATARGGPFSPFPVPKYFFSPLMTTQAQCLAAASGILRRGTGGPGQRIQLTCVPDPRILGNDLVMYRTQRSGDPAWWIPCTVDRLVLPYTADSGPMTVVLKEVTG